MCQNAFRLSVELIELLTRYESYPKIYSVLRYAIDTVMRSAMILMTSLKGVTCIPGNSDPYNDMMDCLGEVFRYFVLAEPDRLADEIRLDANYNFFIRFFILVAGYSSQPGHSKKLLIAILHAMNASCVNIIKFWVY